MAVNPKYMLTPSLQEVFRDKTTGAPLRNGVVYFWQDNARTIPKSVFKQTGSPPNYGYAELPNPLTLSSVGTFQDPNTMDDIKVYYYPYSEENASVVENYFIEVYSEGGKATGVLQFTRQGWPGVVAAESDVQLFENFVPNPQFLVHNDVPATDNTEAGEIIDPITTIAQGGWTFERPSGSTAKDFVLFQPIPYTTNPTGNPRFAANVICEAANPGDDYKDLRLTFQDVNKFASTTQQYTFAFSGQVNTGSAINVDIILIKNYGTNGSTPPGETNLGTITLEVGYQIQQIAAFVFGSNAGKTITADSNVQIAVRFPVNAQFDVNLTDFVLTPNAVTVSEFPDVTDAQVKSQAIAGWVDLPAADGSDLFLVPRLTKYGMMWDDSEIGNVEFESQQSVYNGTTGYHPTTNKLLPIGQQYETAAYSPIGVPMARLQSKYFIDALNMPMYGTGASYFIAASNSAIANQIIVANNSAAAVAAAADGATATGFTFQRTHIGQASPFACKSWLEVDSNAFIIVNTEFGTVTTATAGTSGYGIQQLQVGTSSTREITRITPIVPTPGGVYFTFDVWTGGGDFGYYVWYQVNGVGSDPAVGGRTGILVNLSGGDDVLTISKKTSLALTAAAEVTAINTVAASAIPAGAYFTITASGGGYYVWYKKDGVGTDPAVTNRTGIQVDILGADTNAQVATKTQRAINMKYFAVPDYRGQFLRNVNFNLPIDKGPRFPFVPAPGDLNELGTFEFSSNLIMLSSLGSTSGDLNNFLQTVPSGGIGLAGGADVDVQTTDLSVSVNSVNSSGEESRPVNTNVIFAIRY